MSLHPSLNSAKIDASEKPYFALQHPYTANKKLVWCPGFLKTRDRLEGLCPIHRAESLIKEGEEYMPRRDLAPAVRFLL